MAKVTTDGDGSATIALADGTAVRVPGLNRGPNVTKQDLRNVCTALFALVENLDERLAALEKK
jgi:hypothetical protein